MLNTKNIYMLHKYNIKIKKVIFLSLIASFFHNFHLLSLVNTSTVEVLITVFNK